MPYKKINPEVKTRWVSDLRSGKYEQGIGCLKFVDEYYKGGKLTSRVEYCCIGVLCDISNLGEWIVLANPISKEAIDYVVEGRTRRGQDKNNTGALSHPAVRKWAGLSPKAEKVLADLNDAGISFDEIADWIEANL